MSNIQEYVVFKVNEESYGIDIKYVENIEKMLPITRVPYTEAHVQGVVNLRGNVIPVIDLRKKIFHSEGGFYRRVENNYCELQRIYCRHDCRFVI